MLHVKHISTKKTLYIKLHTFPWIFEKCCLEDFHKFLLCMAGKDGKEIPHCISKNIVKWKTQVDETQMWWDSQLCAPIIITNLRYADDITFTAESEDPKSLLMKVKEQSEKVDLKLNIKKTKIMASGPITSRQIDGATMETLTDFIFGAPRLLQMVTAAMKLRDACSLEEKLWPT